MGQAGRKPKPVQLKVLQGNPGKRALNTDAPRLAVKVPPCPHHITGPARREWRRIGRILIDMGIVTSADHAALEMYCQAYQRWLAAEEKVKEFGLVVDDGGKAVQNPYLVIATQTMRELRALLVEFGLTPSSRSRVKATEKPIEDPFADFLSKKKAADG